MNILVTGGAGYIGSHVCVLLQNEGYKVTIFDNLSNSNITKVNNIKHLSNGEVSFVEGDLRDKDLIKSTIKKIALMLFFILLDLNLFNNLLLIHLSIMIIISWVQLIY